LPISRVSAQENVLEQIIVTARKKEENLQQAPQAVTALTSLALLENGVRNLFDLNQVVPNIEVQAANGNSQVANVFIRGIGQRNQTPMIDSGVGIYMDGVYLGRADGALLDVNDIASVQVLRGPQGTLFGKNTTGGAVMFTTNRPSEVFEASVETRIGNYGRQDSSFVVNVPIAETLLSRLSVTKIGRDGYLENGFDGKSYANEDRISAIGQLRWLASEDLTIDLNLNYSDTDQSARLQECIQVPGIIGWQATINNALQVLPSTGRTYGDFCQDATNFGDERDVISDLGGSYRAETKGVSLTAEWAIRENLIFKSISAWRYTLGGQDSELDHTGIPLLHQSQFVHPKERSHETDQFTQEFQLNGRAYNDRLSYVLGYHYFSEETVNNLASNVLGPFDPGANGLFMFNGTASLFETENTAWAAFAQADWSFSDNWRATMGLRYTDEERRLYREQFAVVPESLDIGRGLVVPVFDGAWFVDRTSFAFNPNYDYFSTSQTSASTGADDVSALGSLQYLITGNDRIENGSVYLTYSESFLSGGLSQAPSGVLETFEPEEVGTVELGVKLDLLDNRLRVNVAAFRADYENRQLTSLVFEPSLFTIAPDTINAAKSTISGFELETTWLPTLNLQFAFNASFNDGQIQEFDDVQLRIANPLVPPTSGCFRADLTVIQLDSCANDRSSENLPRLPESSFFASGQYDIDTRYGIFSPRVQLSYKTDIEYCFDAASCDSGLWLEDRQFDLSARVTWISPDQHWMGSIYGSNLTDEVYLVGGTALTEALGSGGLAVNLPSMYGVELKYSF